MTIGKVASVLLGAAAVAVSPTSVSAQADTFEWSGRMAAGQTLEVKGIAGSVRATLAPGITAEVVAQKRGPRADFDDVTIAVVEDGDRVVVCALYGRARAGRDDCDWDHDGERQRDWGSVSLDVEVDFVVRVPEGVDLVATMVSGDVEAQDLRSDVTAMTVTGGVAVSTSGLVCATTVSGPIDVEMGSMDWDDLSFRTVNGDITLTLPTGLDADVEFESLSGELDSDFDIAVRREDRRWVGSHVEGTIGGGGRSLTLSTVSGDVRLLRGG